MPHKYGYPIKHLDGVIVYSDNNEPVYVDHTANAYKYPSTRTCPKCGKVPTEKGHDPCIANLPGVIGGCCGHGVTEGYIRFENGVVIRGEFKIAEIIEY